MLLLSTSKNHKCNYISIYCYLCVTGSGTTAAAFTENLLIFSLQVLKCLKDSCCCSKRLITSTDTAALSDCCQSNWGHVLQSISPGLECISSSSTSINHNQFFLVFHKKMVDLAFNHFLFFTTDQPFLCDIIMFIMLHKIEQYWEYMITKIINDNGNYFFCFLSS